MTHPQQQKRQLWLGITISLISLGVIFWFINPRAIWTEITQANYIYLLPFLPCLLLFLIFRAFRWCLLLKHQPSLSDAFHIQNIGYMLNMLLPFRLGEVGRVLLISQNQKITVLQSGSTLVTERLFDLLFFVILFPFAIANLPNTPSSLQLAAQISGVIAIVGLLILIIAANQRPLVNKIYDQTIGRFTQAPLPKKLLNDLFDGLYALTNWRDAIRLILWSIIIWLPVLLSYGLLLQAVDLSIPPFSVALVVCCAAFGVAAPSSPGQVGVFHAAVTFALVTILGQSDTAAVSFAFIYHTIQYLFFIIMGFIALNLKNTTWRQIIQLVRRPQKEGV